MMKLAIAVLAVLPLLADDNNATIKALQDQLTQAQAQLAAGQADAKATAATSNTEATQERKNDQNSTVWAIWAQDFGILLTLLTMIFKFKAAEDARRTIAAEAIAQTAAVHEEAKSATAALADLTKVKKEDA